jgi:hypothetical protein
MSVIRLLVGWTTAGSNTLFDDRYSMNSWPATNITAAKAKASIADAIWGASFIVPRFCRFVPVY